MTDFELRCSIACTRSGFLVLAFSCLGFWLLTPLSGQPGLEALGKYTVLRTNLKTHIEQLEKDPCWVSLQKGGKTPEKMPLASLLARKFLMHECRRVLSNLAAKPNPPDEQQPSTQSLAPDGRPAAPTVDGRRPAPPS